MPFTSTLSVLPRRVGAAIPFRPRPPSTRMGIQPPSAQANCSNPGNLVARRREVFAVQHRRDDRRPASLMHRKNMEVVIGGAGAWSGGSYGGLSYVNSFTSSYSSQHLLGFSRKILTPILTTLPKPPPTKPGMSLDSTTRAPTAAQP